MFPARAAAELGSSALGVSLGDRRSHSATVTRRNVAGIDVSDSSVLVFWLLKRSSSSAFSSSSRPLAHRCKYDYLSAVPCHQGGTVITVIPLILASSRFTLWLA